MAGWTGGWLGKWVGSWLGQTAGAVTQPVVITPRPGGILRPYPSQFRRQNAFIPGETIIVDVVLQAGRVRAAGLIPGRISGSAVVEGAAITVSAAIVVHGVSVRPPAMSDEEIMIFAEAA